MYVLIIVLNLVDYLDEIFIKFVEAGVEGATVVDSQGMAGAIAGAQESAVAFHLLKHFIDDCKPYNKTIFTVLESEKQTEAVVALVKEVLGKDARQGAGFMFSLPIGNVYKFDDLQ